MAVDIDIIEDATAPAPEAPEPTDTAADDLAEMEAGGEEPEDESVGDQIDSFFEEGR